MNDDAASARKTVLVAGATGFLGSALCERLLADGHRVVGVDSYFAGSRRNVEHLLCYGDFVMCHGDILNSDFTHEAFDQVFDLGDASGVVHDRWKADRTDSQAVDGVSSIVAAAGKTGARVLRALVEGPGAFRPDRRAWPGGEGGFGALDGRAGHDGGDRRRDQPVRTVRIFNPYGPRMSALDGGVIARFAICALRGKPIKIHGDGCQMRSFCFVDDIVDGLIRAMACSEEAAGPIDLGSSEACMILDLVNIIVEATGTNAKIAFEPSVSTGPMSRLPDLSPAKVLLRWSPTVPLRFGLAETLDYFDELLSERSDRKPMNGPVPIALQSVVA